MLNQTNNKFEFQRNYTTGIGRLSPGFTVAKGPTVHRLTNHSNKSKGILNTWINHTSKNDCFQQSSINALTWKATWWFIKVCLFFFCPTGNFLVCKPVKPCQTTFRIDNSRLNSKGHSFSWPFRNSGIIGWITMNNSERWAMVMLPRLIFVSVSVALAAGSDVYEGQY